MKISTKGRYGLRILLDLAAHQADGRPRLIREIAKSQQISEKYVSRLILALRDAGVVGSYRGAKGGYAIVKPLDQVTLLEAIETMEGPLEVVDCLSADSECPRATTCGPRQFWVQFNNDIRSILQKYTVQDIFNSCCAANSSDPLAALPLPLDAPLCAANSFARTRRDKETDAQADLVLDLVEE